MEKLCTGYGHMYRAESNTLFWNLMYLSIFQVQDLSKVYTTRKGSFLGADNVSLDIPAGKMTALLGPSGSGAHP